MATPPKPPRMTGNAQQDLVAITEWAWAFYRAVVLENAYASNADFLSTVADINEQLIDPAGATVASAQTTANNALTLANTVQNDLETHAQGQDAGGGAVISDLATSVAITGLAEQTDTNYFVVASPTGSSGSPPSGAYIITSISGKTTTGFTLNVGAAPGVGNSVTWNWIVLR
jgi:hypothetical protein